MSMTLDTFMGGALYSLIVANMPTKARLTNHRIRTITLDTHLDMDRGIKLPNPLSLRLNTGGPHFCLFHIGDLGKIGVYDSTGSVLVVELQPGESAKIWLLDNTTAAGEWYAELATTNTARPVSSAPRSVVHENPVESRPSYSPYCLTGCEGSSTACPDEPERVYDEDEEPYVVPMYINSCTAQNSQREPLEAAPLYIPTTLSVQFTADWELDPNHPWVAAGNALSQALKDALWGDGSIIHTLTWRDFDTTRSTRHWHHLRWKGTLGPHAAAWTHDTGSTIAQRHTWEKIITYTLDGVEKHVYIQVVCEFLEEVDSGDLNVTIGAYGSLWDVRVFADEVEPGFADGDTYACADAGAPVQFYKNDPCVSGSTTADNDPALKFCHPQLIIQASVPTTMESPCNYVPKEHPYAAHPEFSYCYLVRNGSPWCASLDPWPGTYRDTGALSSWSDVEENVAFGLNVGHIDKGIMTLGGDTPTSAVEQWLAIENGRGEGRTVLKPTYPGWNENTGQLTATDGFASAYFFWCAPDQDPVLECDVGDPDHPELRTRKTHKCFALRSGLVEDGGCCISVMATADTMQGHPITLMEYCIRTDTTFGDGGGGGEPPCLILSSDCQPIGTFISTFGAHVEDYTYDFGTGGDDRVIFFESHRPDPNAETFSRDPTIEEDWNTADERGTWDVSTDSQVTCTALATGKGWIGYKPLGSLYNVLDWEGTVELTNPTVRIGMYVRGDGDDEAYLVVLDRTPDQERIIFYFGLDEDTQVVLEERDLSSLITDPLNPLDLTLGTLKWEFSTRFPIEGGDPADRPGERVTCTVTLEGAPLASFEILDCRRLDGEVGCWVGNPLAGTLVFSNLKVTDNSVTFLAVTASMGQDSIDCLVDPSLSAVNGGQCDVEVNPDCGVEYCNCVTSSTSGYGVYAFSYTLDEDGLDGGYYGYDFQSYTGCYEGAEPCPECLCGPCACCPGPFRALSFQAIGCNVMVDDVVPWCNGAEIWWYASCTCP